jgi:hypothetical protein
MSDQKPTQARQRRYRALRLAGYSSREADRYKDFSQRRIDLLVKIMNQHQQSLVKAIQNVVHPPGGDSHESN